MERVGEVGDQHAVAPGSEISAATVNRDIFHVARGEVGRQVGIVTCLRGQRGGIEDAEAVTGLREICVRRIEGAGVCHHAERQRETRGENGIQRVGDTEQQAVIDIGQDQRTEWRGGNLRRRERIHRHRAQQHRRTRYGEIPDLDAARANQVQDVAHADRVISHIDRRLEHLRDIGRIVQIVNHQIEPHADRITVGQCRAQYDVTVERGIAHFDRRRRIGNIDDMHNTPAGETRASGQQLAAIHAHRLEFIHTADQTHIHRR